MEHNRRLHFGLMIHGYYEYKDKKMNAYLAYDETWEKYYFEKNVASKNIVFFSDNREAEKFYDTYEIEIRKAGREVFPDPEHTNYNIIMFRPTVEETLPLTDIGEPAGNITTSISYIYIRLYDKNPEVNETYFIGYNNDHGEDEIVASRDFSDVEIFPNKYKAKDFYIKKEDKIKQIADKHRVDGIYKQVDICISDAIIHPQRIYPITTIPYKPKPPYHPHHD